ncbi:hypothetical protein [Desulfobotulus sp.]|jgi:hypothetical protein|uniref:hypothetical protein n=1 Tax=Desulfobotulus sp. TaxID=1940337 RepID=UPI002A35B819|nr:hypothetical protein [Desulfobotulus sp.]MDY0162426.1 hypothetical protein [Desulfobotulus sp.]
MDQSPAYRHMCRKAREIQNQWVPARGDVYLLARGEDRPQFWMDATGPQAFRKGFAILRENGIIRIEPRIWLPRQNQLMDLAQVPGVRFQDMTFRFHAFAGKPLDREKNPDLRSLTTLEQLWLAFVMISRFGKRWDGLTWAPIAPVTA